MEIGLLKMVYQLFLMFVGATRELLTFCCNGIAQKGTIAIGSHGCIKLLTERPFFEAGLEHVVKTILPRTIVVYGAAPDNIFDKYVKCGIDIIQFDSVYMSTHRKAVES